MLLLLLLTAVAASLHSSRGAWVNTAANQQLGAVGYHLSPPVVALVRPLLEEAFSAVIVHDGSRVAQRVTHDLISQPSTSLVLGDMKSLLEDPHTLATFRGHQLNANLGLTILLFSNVSVVSRFLADKSPGWLSTSLLLLSLSLHNDARELLVEAQEVRWSALLQAKLTTRNSLRHFIVNFLPYNPPGSQFHLQVCDGRPLTRGQVFLERYRHFHGRELQVASWLDDFPFLFYDTGGQVQGMAKVMLDEVASRLHFTYHLQEEPPDGYWGELVNGTWMGMAGQLVRHEKDLIIDGFAILLDRYHSLDLSVPYFTDSYSAALQMPPPAPRWVAVVYPFQGVVWASVVVALLLLALTLHAFIRAHPHTFSTHKATVVSTMLWVSSGVVRQPMPQLPQGSWGCRPLLAAWWLAAVVLSTSYTGSITAFLTVPRQAPKISTLHDLAKADSKLFLLDYGAFLPGYLRTSVDPVYRALGEKLHLVESYDAIRVKMEAGHAFVEGRHYTQATLIRWRMADAYIVEEKMFPNYNGWAFRKGTPWTPMFNKYLLRMMESGLVNHWHRTILAGFRRDHGLTPHLLEGNLLSLRPLSLSDSQGTFIIMGFGTALAIIGFILEFLCHRLRAREADGNSLVEVSHVQ